ncbi:hypothetical protein [Putridiphycobacter roseus]|uniref:hypothetical protein n=1 Tax=Putridiphycobacter roseus TaxID=2219161 RepID=UPI003628D786
MKNLQKLVLLFSTALFFLSASCEKQDPEPVFREGFTCKINGEEWIAKTPASVGGAIPISITYNENSGWLHIRATKKNSDENIYDDGNYKMFGVNIDGDEMVGFLSLENNGNSCAGYLHDSLNPGNIEICRFDKTKREVEGTFNMTLINRDCTDSLMYITDGKFAFWY